MKYLKLFFTIIIILLVKFLLFDNLKENNLTVAETIELNYKLYLIKSAGLIDLNKNKTRQMLFFMNDPLCIKFFRRMFNKYGDWVYGDIITNARNILILSPELSKKILDDSPFLFNAGYLKRDFFLHIMPNNLGISECDRNQLKCPWKKRREFNDKSLGFKKATPFFRDLVNIVNDNLLEMPTNIKMWKEVAKNITALIITGNKDEKTKYLIQKFIYLGYNEKLTIEFKREFYKYMDECAKKCGDNNLLHYTKIYRNDDLKVIHDQLPHWFAPFCFMITYLIPNFICIILNFDDIKDKIMKEISCEQFNIFSKKTYIHYCVIEHIRLFNTNNINLQRTAKMDMDYEGISIKKNDQIFILLSNILRDKNKFNKPDNYIPERWESKSVKDQSIVFGVGPQVCPSTNISPVLYKAILIQILKKFKTVECIYPKLNKRSMHFINPFDIQFKL